MPRHLVLSFSALFLLALGAELAAQGREPSGSRPAARRTVALQPAKKTSVDPEIVAAAARTAKVNPKAISAEDAAGRKLTLTTARAVSSRLHPLATGRYLGTLDTQTQGPRTKLPPGKYNLFLSRQADRWHLYFESGGKIVGEAAEVNVRSFDPKNRAERGRDSVNLDTGAVTLRAERPLSKRGKPLLSAQEAIRSVELRGDSATAATAALEAELEFLISEAGRLLKADAAKDVDAMSDRLEELRALKKRINDRIKKQLDAQAAYEKLRDRLRGAVQNPDEELKRLAAKVEAAAAEVLDAVTAFKAAVAKVRADAKAVVTDATRRAAAKAEDAARAAAESVKKAADKVSAATQQALDAAAKAAEEAAEAAAQVADDAAQAAEDSGEAATDTATDVVEAIVSFFF